MVENKILTPGAMVPIAGPDSDFKLRVGRGDFTGITPIFFSGYNSAVGAVQETVRSVGGRYPFPTTAEGGSIWSAVSTDANDTVAGTGARTVIKLSLDVNYEEQAEIITLDGLTPVAGLLEDFRVNFFQIITSGTGKVNAGVIDLLNGTDVMARIEIGKGRSLQCVQTVPAGKTWYTGTFTPSCGKDDEIAIDAFAFDPNGTGFVTSLTYFYQNNFTFTNMNNVGFPAKHDFEAVAQKTGGGADSRASLVLEFLEDTN